MTGICAEQCARVVVPVSDCLSPEPGGWLAGAPTNNRFVTLSSLAPTPPAGAEARRDCEWADHQAHFSVGDPNFPWHLESGGPATRSARAWIPGNPPGASVELDGVLDGWEVLRLPADRARSSQDPRPGYRSSPFLDDTDSDRLPDSLEWSLTETDLTPATDLAAGKFRADKDPATSTDPMTLDSDGDGVADGWLGDDKYLVGGIITNYPTDPSLAPYGAGNASAPDWWEGEDRDLDGD
jgi:hypothetical protein